MSPLTRRATAAYRAATAEQIDAGHRWYVDAHDVAASQAEYYGTTVTVAAGVLAATSPRLGWGPNVSIAERMLASGGTLERGALGRSLSQARAICAGEDPDVVLRGPKTNAFYHAILTAGESPDPVIDRHAWDMLVGKRGAPAPNLGQYRQAAAVMRRAAKILCVGVHEAQATTWLVQRAKYWNPGAFDLTARKPMLNGAEVRWQDDCASIFEDHDEPSIISITKKGGNS